MYYFFPLILSNLVRHWFLGLNDCALCLCASEILVHKLALLLGGVSLSGHFCCLHWAVSFIYYLKHSRLEGNWNAWRRRLGVSMQLLSFGLTGLDWRYFPTPSFCPPWTPWSLAPTNLEKMISYACWWSAQSLQCHVA